jgi:hypothetical protein
MLKMKGSKVVKSCFWVALVVFLIIVLTLLTSYYGTTDTGDYADSAKYFSGEYSAKIRSSHSYLLGFVHAPLVALTNSFIFFKVSSLVFLLLLVYSVYRITNRNKHALWLMLLSPSVWYMAPWINPIQIAALFFVWAYYFINRYEQKEGKELKNLAYAGMFIGLGWCFWDTVWLFGAALAFVFMFNKKVWHSLYLAAFVMVGLIPRMALDYSLFSFPFYSILKNFSAMITAPLGGAAGLGSGNTPVTLLHLLPVLIIVPYLFWKLYKPKNFAENKKSMIFLSLGMLFILSNPQIRYTLILAPIIAILLVKTMGGRELNRLILVSGIISLLVAVPYAIEIAHPLEVNGEAAEFATIFAQPASVTFGGEWTKDRISNDLNKIIEDYPDRTFLVGNAADGYQTLADIYWGNEVKEFVSIQDYNLYLKNSTVLFEKKFMPSPKIDERRQIWIAGGMGRNVNDNTDYGAIEYAIGIGEKIDADGFELVEKYDVLYLSKKSP